MKEEPEKCVGLSSIRLVVSCFSALKLIPTFSQSLFFPAYSKKESQFFLLCFIQYSCRIIINKV